MLSAETLFRELRQSVRSLIREKSFTLTVLGILALCFAANVAIFAVVNAALLKPLPFRDSHQLVLIANAYPKAGVERAAVSVPHYLERKEGLPGLSAAAAVKGSGVTIGDAGSPERVDSMTVTPSFFDVLGVSPKLGRAFQEEEGFYGKHEVVIISDGLWRQRFGADPAVIGRTLRINTTPHTIVGVMPPNFRYLSSKPKLWTPLCFSGDDRKADRRHANNMDMIARLRPSVPIAELQAQVEALNERTLKTDPIAKMVVAAGFETNVHDLGRDYVAKLRPVLLLLQAGVLFLLLIGLVNLANLFLVRATGRAKEQSVRQALGASAFQLVRVFVLESVLLSVIGGLIGMGLGFAALRAAALIPADQLPMELNTAFDPAVIVTVLCVSILLGVVLAIPLVWQSLKGNLNATLAVESRGGTTTRSVHRLRHALIVAQVALAFVLLSGTGLLALSFNRVLSVDPGFTKENILTGELALPWSNYREEQHRVAFLERLVADVGTLPGVKSVGVITTLPFGGQPNNNAVAIEDRPLAEGESLRAHFTSGVTADYFQTMGVPLREGRFLNADDNQGALRACVIDEDVARRYWPEGGAVGRRLANGGPPKTPDDYFTIVGVVGSVKQDDLADSRSIGAVYFPYKYYASLDFVVVIRTTQAPELAATALRSAVVRVDPELAVHGVKTMADRVDESLSTRRAPLLLSGIFAVVALTLAAVGIYGVLAYTVAQRQREIGVRMALGAEPGQILRQFLGLGGRLLIISLPIGLLGAWSTGQGMTGLLFGVSPANIAVLAGTAAVLTGVALLACFLPARRAANVSPIEALRAD